MTPLATDHVLIKGTRIAHRVLGEGRPLVLIHGTPSSSLIWREVAPALVSAGYRVHLFDLLGFGLSERPWDPEIDTSVSGQVPILEGLWEHWALDQADVVAHDIGGAVAKRFALDHLERLRSLTLIDIVSFDSWPSPRTKQQVQAGMDALLRSSAEDHAAHFRSWLQSAVADTERFAGSAQEAYLAYISNPVGQASLFQHQIRHYDGRHTMEIADRLSELGRIPVQILWGAKDQWQAPAWSERLSAAIPGSTVALLDGCGHFAMEDRPDLVTRHLTAFLDRT